MSKPYSATANQAAIAKLASAFAVNENVLRSAFAKFHERQRDKGIEQPSDVAVIKRLEKVRAGLELELGGENIVQDWLQQKNVALEDRRPVDLLADGRVEVLERIHKALKTSQFS